MFCQSFVECTESFLCTFNTLSALRSHRLTLENLCTRCEYNTESEITPVPLRRYTRDAVLSAAARGASMIN